MNVRKCWLKKFQMRFLSFMLRLKIDLFGSVVIRIFHYKYEREWIRRSKCSV